MDVDFNNLRKQSVYALERVIRKLNNSIDEYGEVRIDAEDIEDDLNNALSCVRITCCVFEDGNDNFKDLSEDIGEPKWFNDNDDE